MLDKSRSTDAGRTTRAGWPNATVRCRDVGQDDGAGADQRPVTDADLLTKQRPRAEVGAHAHVGSSPKSYSGGESGEVRDHVVVSQGHVRHAGHMGTDLDVARRDRLREEDAARSDDVPDPTAAVGWTIRA